MGVALANESVALFATAASTVLMAVPPVGLALNGPLTAACGSTMAKRPLDRTLPVPLSSVHEPAGKEIVIVPSWMKLPVR